jgi:S1-C subfamily serine protease
VTQDPDWDIPEQLQPAPEDYSFDLDKTLRSVVSLTANVPPDAYTASVLGTERCGSGVVVAEGIVATIGYLITEAETIWLVSADGRATPGHALGFDSETGLGLVQALGRLDAPPIPCGDPSCLSEGDHVLFAAGGGRRHAVEARVAARHEFAGYWEYVLDDALFVAPAHPFWGGGALINAEGKLCGIGSLIVQQGDPTGGRMDMNMVVPIDRLPPVMDDILRTGAINRPPRPWLGLYAVEGEDTLTVGGLAPRGPAELAGLRSGDRIVAVDGEEVTDLASLWRRVWASGSAGSYVTMQLKRKGQTLKVRLRSADRGSFLKAPRLH